MHDFTIIGGGIVGLAVGMTLTKAYPGADIALLEKEEHLARHQTGRNSGVVHSGIYYRPGSYKARYARAGNRSMFEFCREHGLPHERCGKLIAAADETELGRLEDLYRRGRQNGLEVRRLSQDQAKEIEPHLRCRAALLVPSTGIADFGRVAETYAEKIESAGGTIRVGTRVQEIRRFPGGYRMETDRGNFDTRFLVNCAGLFSDRIARLAGAELKARIIPFRGEYYDLIPGKKSLVRNLIYPVPNPAFPFLGVHFTRVIDGSVHAGPNAVLSLKREGYLRSDFDLADAADTLLFPGFWKLAWRHSREGFRELRASLSKAAFVRELRRLIPEIGPDDVVPGSAGVRAQALERDGRLVDDFLLVAADRALHVCNAPSPAATCSLEIGKAVVDKIRAILPSRTRVGGLAAGHRSSPSDMFLRPAAPASARLIHKPPVGSANHPQPSESS